MTAGKVTVGPLPCDARAIAMRSHDRNAVPGTHLLPGPAGAAQEEHLLLLRKATAAGLLLEHMYVLVCICIHLVAERAPTRRLPLTSPSLAGWPGGCGERGTCAAVFSRCPGFRVRLCSALASWISSSTARLV